MEEDIANVYKQNFPNDIVIVGDAHQYLLDHCHEFDFIWTSPPCQTHSRMMKATRHKKNRYTDMSLYQEILFLQHFYKGKWVVENVKPYYEPLIKPKAVIGRHYFWANFEIKNVVEPKQPKGFITKGTAAETQELKEWLGIHYEGNIYYKDNHCLVKYYEIVYILILANTFLIALKIITSRLKAKCSYLRIRSIGYNGQGFVMFGNLKN